MKEKYVRPRKRVMRKKAMILTLIVSALAQGIPFTEQEVLALTNTYKEVNIVYEADATSVNSEEVIEFDDWDSYIAWIKEQTANNKDIGGTVITKEKEEEDPTAIDSYWERLSYKNGCDNSRDLYYINVKNPENRFDGLDDPNDKEAQEHKEIVKTCYSAKFWDAKNFKKYFKYAGEAGGRGEAYLLYNYIPLRKGIEGRFGIKNVYGGGIQDTKYGVIRDKVPVRNTTMGSALCLNKRMRASLTDKTSRKYLTQLAVEAGITTASDTSAPEAALAVYYGIFNNSLSTTNYKYSPNTVLTRLQARVLATKFNRGWGWGDLTSKEENSSEYISGRFGKKYAEYTSDRSFFLSIDNYTTKQAKSQATNLEFICDLAHQYYDFEQNRVKVTDDQMKKVIKKYNLSSNPSKYLAKAKKREISGDAYVKMVISKSKQFDIDTLRCITIADRVGMITPNSNGKYNWYGKLTEKKALKIMTKAAMSSYYPVLGGYQEQAVYDGSDRRKELRVACGIKIPGLYNYDVVNDCYVKQSYD